MNKKSKVSSAQLSALRRLVNNRCNMYAKGESNVIFEASVNKMYTIATRYMIVYLRESLYRDSFGDAKRVTYTMKEKKHIEKIINSKELVKPSAKNLNIDSSVFVAESKILRSIYSNYYLSINGICQPDAGAVINCHYDRMKAIASFTKAIGERYIRVRKINKNDNIILAKVGVFNILFMSNHKSYTIFSEDAKINSFSIGPLHHIVIE